MRRHLIFFHWRAIGALAHKTGAEEKKGTVLEKKETAPETITAPWVERGAGAGVLQPDHPFRLAKKGCRGEKRGKIAKALLPPHAGPPCIFQTPNRFSVSEYSRPHHRRLCERASLRASPRPAA